MYHRLCNKFGFKDVECNLERSIFLPTPRIYMTRMKICSLIPPVRPPTEVIIGMSLYTPSHLVNHSLIISYASLLNIM